MFSVDYLHVIREYEYNKVIGCFPSDARILEIGGGTGYQAKRLTQDGYAVDSIDLPLSNYSDHQEFPVQPYDGKNIPFPTSSFDVIFSSNVLEHVKDLPYLQAEMTRVLKSGGVCVHLMPTGAWRFWTNLAHYVELGQRLISLSRRLLPRRVSKHAFRESLGVLRLMAGTAIHYAIVPRHGETGNAWSEIVTFSVRSWTKHFLTQRFAVVKVKPIGLFYTGHMVLGPKLSIAAREMLAKWLGSACVIYVVRPT